MAFDINFINLKFRYNISLFKKDGSNVHLFFVHGFEVVFFYASFLSECCEFYNYSASVIKVSNLLS